MCHLDISWLGAKRIHRSQVDVWVQWTCMGGHVDVGHSVSRTSSVGITNSFTLLPKMQLLYKETSTSISCIEPSICAAII